MPYQFNFKVSGDNWRGPAIVRFKPDNAPPVDVTVTAARVNGERQPVTFATDGKPARIVVSLVNDLWGDLAKGEDRNAYIESAEVNGYQLTGSRIDLFNDNPVTIDVPYVPPMSDVSAASIAQVAGEALMPSGFAALSTPVKLGIGAAVVGGLLMLLRK